MDIDGPPDGRLCTPSTLPARRTARPSQVVGVSPSEPGTAPSASGNMACMPPPRGQVLRDRLAVATAGASDVEAVGHRVLTVLGRFVPFEYACLATTDPATGLITGAIKSSVDDMGEEEFAHYEYAVDDLNQFADIARR